MVRGQRPDWEIGRHSYCIYEGFLNYDRHVSNDNDGLNCNGMVRYQWKFVSRK